MTVPAYCALGFVICLVVRAMFGLATLMDRHETLTERDGQLPDRDGPSTRGPDPLPRSRSVSASQSGAKSSSWRHQSADGGPGQAAADSETGAADSLMASLEPRHDPVGEPSARSGSHAPASHRKRAGTVQVGDAIDG